MLEVFQFDDEKFIKVLSILSLLISALFLRIILKYLTLYSEPK